MVQYLAPQRYSFPTPHPSKHILQRWLPTQDALLSEEYTQHQTAKDNGCLNLAQAEILAGVLHTMTGALRVPQLLEMLRCVRLRTSLTTENVLRLHITRVETGKSSGGVS
jgi:hypothetical protein